MKIVHCADVHLDSPLKSLDSTQKRKTRNSELLCAFTDMVDFAAREGAAAVLISGDLFDKSKVSATTKGVILEKIRHNPAMGFYYAKGNHDVQDFAERDEWPANLHIFGEAWESFALSDVVCLTGASLNESNARALHASLALEVNKFNIVMLHGQESQARPGDNTQIVSLRELAHKNIDYLALGHVHEYTCEQLDARATYCYPGCLESRGYDEAGKHGFVVLDIDEAAQTFTSTLVCHPKRSVHVVPVDISGLEGTSDVMQRIEEVLAQAYMPSSDMVKIELVGKVDVGFEVSIDYLQTMLSGRFFDSKVKDLTELRIDYGAYRLDESLRGEFVRLVEADETLSDEDKAEIIKIGIDALAGKEIA